MCGGELHTQACRAWQSMETGKEDRSKVKGMGSLKGHRISWERDSGEWPPTDPKEKWGLSMGEDPKRSQKSSFPWRLMVCECCLRYMQTTARGK